MACLFATFEMIRRELELIEMHPTIIVSQGSLLGMCQKGISHFFFQCP